MQHVLVRPLLAIAVVAFCLCAGIAKAADLAGSIVGVSGTVALLRGGQSYPPRVGDPVYTNDNLQVAADGRLKLRLSDGSIESFASSTSGRIDALLVDAAGRRRSATISVGQGLLRSITAPGGNPGSFEVNTATGTAAVRSTDWFVEASPGAEQVSVLSGSVALTSRSTGGFVLIPAGMTSRLDAGRNPEPPRPLTQQEIASLISRTDGAGGAAPPPAPTPPPAPPPTPQAPPPGGQYYPPPSGGPYYPQPYQPGGYYPPGGYPPGGYYPPAPGYVPPLGGLGGIPLGVGIGIGIGSGGYGGQQGGSGSHQGGSGGYRQPSQPSGRDHNQ